MRIAAADASDVESAVRCLESAFASDPLIAYFFRTHPEGVSRASARFFSLLLRLRIALAMPALVLEAEDDVLGVAMGYDTSRPVWPEPFAGEWADLEAATPGLAGRLHAYESLSRSHQPPSPHHYLGVLGVHPSVQGQGAGKALLEAFCQLAADDPRSSGVYLDTANARSRDFYLRSQFELQGEGELESLPLWCVLRSNPVGPEAARARSLRGESDG